MAETDGCVKPSKGPIGPPVSQETSSTQTTQEVRKMIAKVGGPAPDFEATAYVPGEGFRNIKLSDYKGKWLVLCFYPGDFTFV